MQVLLLLSFIFLSSAKFQPEVNCTEGTLKFSECQDQLLPVKWCHEDYRDTLDLIKQLDYDRAFPNKTHEDEFCKSRISLLREHMRCIGNLIF